MPQLAKIFVAIAILCGAAPLTACSAAIYAPAADAGVALAAQFPSDVTFGKPAQRTSETIALTLTNNTASAVTLQKPNACQTHTWTVSDSAGQIVDDQTICPMIYIPVKLPLAPHGAFTATETVALNGTKFEDGARYTLHYTFWGIETDARFMAHAGQ